MGIQAKIVVACICSSIWFQFSSSDELLNSSPAVKLTCTCASSSLGELNHSAASNCSASCNCTPEKGPGLNGEGWTCLCASAATGTNNDNCFTSCNCTSGVPSLTESEKKQVSSKLIVAILLLCVVLTTIAFLGSLACYFYRKDRFLARPTISSSDKSASWNSVADLLSHPSSVAPYFQVKANSQFNPATGFIHRALCFFRSKSGRLPGTIIQFSYLELDQATNNFSNNNLIGIGGSSNVYHGQLKDGRVVAIKKLNTLGSSDADSGFLSEIELISRLNHCHVVPLLGYCSEFQGKNIERLLVFEYMTNGNLRDCLDASTNGKEAMDWGTRVSIALGAARGLEYLHEAAAPRILHRDVKSTNILLDEKYQPKITDLGMAKRLITDDYTSCTSSPARMMGTFGYFAPEYAIIGKASPKSDVFSFGVVILELITGRQPIHKSSNKGDESLVIWAASRLGDSKLVISELPDPLVKGNFPEEEMQIMAHLARECLQWDPDSRPTMSEVVQILSTISPDKSKRRNFSISLFSNSLSRSTKNSIETERHGEISECSTERREMDRVDSERRQARCSLPLSVDRDLCEDNRKNDHAVLSAQYMEKLIMLSSNAGSWRPSEDEIVDLTEPRFESFVQANIRSP